MDAKITVMKVSEVMKYPKLVDDIVACFVAVYNATGEGEWGENWTHETAHERLFGDADKIADFAYMTILHKGIKTVGFTMTLVGPLDQVINASEMPPAHATEENAEQVRGGIRDATGTENPSVMFYRDIGIEASQRQGLAMAVGMVIAVAPLVQNLGVSWGGGWTVRKSKLFRLLDHFDFSVVHDFNDEAGHVVIGENYPHGWHKLEQGSGV